MPYIVNVSLQCFESPPVSPVKHLNPLAPWAGRKWDSHWQSHVGGPPIDAAGGKVHYACGLSIRRPLLPNSAPLLRAVDTPKYRSAAVPVHEGMFSQPRSKAEIWDFHIRCRLIIWCGWNEQLNFKGALCLGYSTSPHINFVCNISQKHEVHTYLNLNVNVSNGYNRISSSLEAEVAKPALAPAALLATYNRMHP
jgi:hypothetical protein